jgi:hypothetical protein
MTEITPRIFTAVMGRIVDLHIIRGDDKSNIQSGDKINLNVVQTVTHCECLLNEVGN